MRALPIVLLVFSLTSMQRAFAAPDVPVPTSCTASVNQHLADLLAAGTHTNTDNVMVCGSEVRNSRTQAGGPHGDHQILALKVEVPNGKPISVEVVSNDDLDGKVTAKTGDTVYAYGQAFFLRRGAYVAGVHDVHCSTHRGADNGWVVVNTTKYPTSCTSSRRW